MSEVIRDAVIAFLSAVGIFSVVWMLAGTVYRARHKMTGIRRRDARDTAKRRGLF